MSSKKKYSSRTSSKNIKNIKNSKNIKLENQNFDYKTDTFRVIEDYIKHYFNKHHIDSFSKNL